MTGAGEGDGWSAWTRIARIPPLQGPVLAEILDGGQAFRWFQLEDASWAGTWAENLVRIRRTPAGDLEWSAPKSLAPQAGPELSRYFAAEVDFADVSDALPWRSDAHLARCIDAFRGLRILRQPFGETLLGFLCSATKQIVQIKQMLDLLAQRHGSPLVPGRDGIPPVTRTTASAGNGRGSAAAGDPASGEAIPSCRVPTVAMPGAEIESSIRSAAVPPNLLGPNRLPSWPELARVPEPELRRCLLGFRARYIAETARFLDAHPGWLQETESMPYAEAKIRLCSLPGVGEKVADCVLLFGAGRLEAFPVDVWILRTLASRYGLRRWKPSELARFGRIHFGPKAGLAQQYLFAWERLTAAKSQPKRAVAHMKT